MVIPFVFLCPWVFVFTLLSSPIRCELAAQQVDFDVSRTVACQVVSPSVGLPLGLKQIEARLSVSLLVYGGHADEVTECLYRFVNGTNTAQIVDYVPRTTMGDPVVGNVQVRQSREKSDEVNLSISAGADSVHANTGGSKGDSSQASFAYELMPPRSMIAAAGTTRRGSGVYFKLHRTPQNSLEGAREFRVTLQVPSDWRGGYLQASCQAVHRAAGTSDVLGSGAFVVPLYLASDTQSRRAAEALVDAEQRLYATAHRYQREIQRRSQPTIAHELAFIDPKIPKTWLGQIVVRPADSSPFGFERRLPTELREAIANYRQARETLSGMRIPETDVGCDGTLGLLDSALARRRIIVERNDYQQCRSKGSRRERQNHLVAR